MHNKIRHGMIPCHVQRLCYGPWLVTFRDPHNRTVFLQFDYDQAAFAVGSGAIKAPRNWSGTVDALGPVWEQFDLETIQSCSDEYLTV